MLKKLLKINKSHNTQFVHMFLCLSISLYISFLYINPIYNVKKGIQNEFLDMDSNFLTFCL